MRQLIKDTINIHQVPGRVSGEMGLDIKSTNKLKTEAAIARYQANYLKSPIGIMEATIKGMPKAAKEMSKAMVDYLKKRIK